MKKYPLPVLVVAIALMIAGIVGFFYHLKEFADPDQKLYVTMLVEPPPWFVKTPAPWFVSPRTTLHNNCHHHFL